MAVVKESDIPYEVVEYHKPEQRPGKAALQKLLGILVDPPEDLVRKDAHFKALQLDAADYIDNSAAVAALLAEHIELMQRPVLVYKNRAMIGRPKTRIATFLTK